MKTKFKKCFIISVVSTLFVLILLIGFLVVEKNTQAVIFETNSPFFEFKHDKFIVQYFKIHFMGKDFILNFN